MKYHSYHTHLKTLCKSNKLPENYLKQINRTTIWRWKHEPEDKYLGSELSDIDILEHFISQKEAQKVMRTYLKTALVIKTVIAASRSFKKLIKDNTSKLVETVLKFKKDIDYKILLRILEIPLSVYYYWRDKLLYKCENSAINLCKRKYPSQLLNKEVAKMKELLFNAEYRYWPVSSIALQALRENLVNVSLNTWYKYIKLLGIDRPGVPKTKKYPKSIVADTPNQYWHADITIVKTLDGVKNYVYLLMDNFSKYIINWRVETKVRGAIRAETIKDAYEGLQEKSDVNLIIDCGPENMSQNVDAYVNSNDVKIVKLVALKDVPFSNSVVEAQNKLLKYWYLFKQPAANTEALIKQLEWVVPDYNEIRPHISLKGLTPNESYNGITMDKNARNEQILKAKALRLEENQTQTAKSDNKKTQKTRTRSLDKTNYQFLLKIL